MTDPASTATRPTIRPFELAVPQAALDDLAARLDATRWPDDPTAPGWSQGVPPAYLRELAAYWRTAYDWREHEAHLNRFPQFMTTIDGTGVHFLHVRSPEPDALPLLITHGWPGSVVEFLDVIGPLTDPRAYDRGASADAFDLVIPTIPGYGLSGPTRDPGWDIRRVAGAWAELMRRLGYDRYGAQGGDWGHAITLELAALAPERVIAIHLNTLLTLPPDDPAVAADLTDDDRSRLSRLLAAEPEMSAYAKIQGTRPQTLAYALTDSPVGQLAWIVEKFKEWTDNTDVPEDAVPRDRLLTNVMLYWLTATAGSSARHYWEAAHPSRATRTERPSTPTGVAVFSADIARPVRRLAERDRNIVHWSELPRGGHFAAMEQPELFTADVRAFFRRFR
ncbi:epoxide hydrolase family protein [Streptomyces sp. DSM 40750]|uniref:epoxide hydrolase family protein n=1 Tax=Streptomyces sp. DSM 40750 TaxID=2801030 RepID=UPI00214AC922|nr:epoxide hydrolase family protein [Streptomyces sp. DSM 40750]UUU23243.1 epoxide hydrolase [Streptomyces sp. DSM 40750]